MFTRRAGFARPFAFAMAAIFLHMATACSTPKPPTPFQTREDAEDFRQSLLTDARTIDKFTGETRAGENVSEFSLGWLVYTILVSASSTDERLYHFFNADGRDTQLYLRTTFHDHPVQQIAALDALIAEHPSPLRYAARYALESLRHIPESDEPPNAQQRDRGELADNLARLSANLKQAAAEVHFP